MAAVDTNVRRVLTRREGEIDVSARADELLPRGRAATFNQAMMELGATVCRPRNPDCAQCPVERGCLRLVVTPARRVKQAEIRRHRPVGARARDRSLLQGRRSRCRASGSNAPSWVSNATA